MAGDRVMQERQEPKEDIERGRSLHKSGRLEEARAIYRSVLERDPANADALHLLGVVANQQGDFHTAANLISRAIDIAPNAENYHANLGIALKGQGHYQLAQKQFEIELKGNPKHIAAHVNLGAVLQEQGKIKHAIEHYREAQELAPSHSIILNNLAAAYLELNDHDAALQVCQDALRIESNNADTHNMLGLILKNQGHLIAAIEHFNTALQVKPDSYETLQNLGTAYKELGDTDTALLCYDQALEIKADYPATHYSKGLTLLLLGRFAEAWEECEWGLLAGERKVRDYPYPQWKGEPLDGKTILVCAEQGLGDEILFASIIPEIIGESKHCVIECNPKLEKLYRRSFPSATVVAWGGGMPDMIQGCKTPLNEPVGIDVQIPVGSLPLYRRRELADFAKSQVYLYADPTRVAYWRQRLDELGTGLKIGLSWRGGTVATGGARRSLGLDQLLPIIRRPDIHVISLQYTDCAEELRSFRQNTGLVIHHWQEAIDDYDETAALVSAVDLTISVPTAIVNLVAALEKPVWVMVPSVPGWGFMREGQRSPWLVSARLFRQATPSNWDDVIAEIVRALRSVKGGRF